MPTTSPQIASPESGATQRRPGWLRRVAMIGAVLLLLVAAFAYWNLFRTPHLQISPETTFITAPLRSDGKGVDFFAALEQERYPPEMQTDQNGYRLLVQALGVGLQPANGVSESTVESKRVQVYQRLGLDAGMRPTLTYQDPDTFLTEYGKHQNMDETQAYQLTWQLQQSWDVNDLPMMEEWLRQNRAALDLLGHAVREPVFRFPLVCAKQESWMFEVGRFELQRMRSLMRGLAARANYCVGTGDIDGASYDIITCVRLGRQLERQGMCLMYLVGLAVECVARSSSIAGNPESPPTQAQLEHFVEELRAAPSRGDLQDVFQCERYIALAVLQAFANGGTNEELVSDSQILRAVRFVGVDWNVVMRRLNDVYDAPERFADFSAPTSLSLGDVFLGPRSCHYAEFFADFLVPGFQGIREAKYRAECDEQLQAISLAMLLYEREHGELPPAYTVDQSGRPLHSWRVLLLPYLGYQELYGQLILDEPYNSQHNRQFHDAAPDVYRCPSAGLAQGETVYTVVVGAETAFGPGKGKALDRFGSHLLLVTEREEPVGWMEPTKEVAREVAEQGINRNQRGLGSAHPCGMHAAIRGGSVHFVTDTVRVELLAQLLAGTAEQYPW